MTKVAQRVPNIDLLSSAEYVSLLVDCYNPQGNLYEDLLTKLETCLLAKVVSEDVWQTIQTALGEEKSLRMRALVEGLTEEANPSDFKVCKILLLRIEAGKPLADFTFDAPELAELAALFKEL
jgi:hypothetical protein